MVRTYLKYRDRGVQFVGLTTENDLAREAVAQFIEKHGIPWTVGLSADDTFAALEVELIPTVVVVGRDGRIVWKNHFADDGLEQAIEKALAAN